MVDQIAIFVFGLAAIWLVNDPRSRVARWGSVCGLIAQPFWYWTTYSHEQWGMLASCPIYTWSWARGFYYSWLAHRSSS